MLIDAEPKALLPSPADFHNTEAVQWCLVFLKMTVFIYFCVSASGGVCTYAMMHGGGSQKPTFKNLLPLGTGD